MREDISGRVRKIVVQQTKRRRIIDPALITEEASFESLGFDSLDAIEIIMGIEEEFDVEISDEAADGLLTFGQAVEYLVQRLQVAA